jgi:hypothetical protein
LGWVELRRKRVLVVVFRERRKNSSSSSSSSSGARHSSVHLKSASRVPSLPAAVFSALSSSHRKEEETRRDRGKRQREGPKKSKKGKKKQRPLPPSPPFLSFNDLSLQLRTGRRHRLQPDGMLGADFHVADLFIVSVLVLVFVRVERREKRKQVDGRPRRERGARRGRSPARFVALLDCSSSSFFFSSTSARLRPRSQHRSL